MNKYLCTVEMFGIELYGPEGFLVNEGIRSRKIRDGGSVQLSICKIEIKAMN